MVYNSYLKVTAKDGGAGPSLAQGVPPFWRRHAAVIKALAFGVGMPLLAQACCRYKSTRLWRKNAAKESVRWGSCAVHQQELQIAYVGTNNLQAAFCYL